MTTDARRHADDAGFTLLEVLVAFTIASFLLVAILRALTLGLDGSQRSEAYTRATILAESTLDAMGVTSPLRDGEEAELQKGAFHITASVHRYSDPSLPSGPAQYLVLYRLSATVSWRERRQERSFSLQTLRLAPAQNPS
ncbi:MAG TPA: prepilin-type N-terminal cleavage/methylation domain-containing protein [Alphaproteobacteria bacterium]|nr:prepilin-type N-terminal cleavage/methylation domain-containing protein [Alphaproteobacteria bacterium]